MNGKTLLLVEDNANEVVVVRDRVGLFYFLSSAGARAGCDVKLLPVLTLNEPVPQLS